jgi:hypothetical protein
MQDLLVGGQYNGGINVWNIGLKKNIVLLVTLLLFHAQ